MRENVIYKYFQDKNKYFIEKEVLKCSNLNFIPQLVEYSDSKLLIVREYLQGDIISQKNLSNDNILTELNFKMQLYHSINLKNYLIVQSYDAYLLKVKKKIEWLRVKRYNMPHDIDISILEKIKDNKNLSRVVFLHNDMKTENIIISGDSLKLIDFENSTYGPIIFELSRIFLRVFRCNAKSKGWNYFVSCYNFTKFELCAIYLFSVFHCVSSIYFYETSESMLKSNYYSIYTDAVTSINLLNNILKNY